jgi:hypothetical protein
MDYKKSYNRRRFENLSKNNLNKTNMKDLQQILNLSTHQKNYNTNNAWGFGGGEGKSYLFRNGSEIRIGKACYRHSPSSNYVAVYDKDGRKCIDIIKFDESYLDLAFEIVSEK